MEQAAERYYSKRAWLAGGVEAPLDAGVADSGGGGLPLRADEEAEAKTGGDRNSL